MQGISVSALDGANGRERAGRSHQGSLEGAGRWLSDWFPHRPQMVSLFRSTVECRECEIFIGTGHVERVPLPSPDGAGYLCQSCWHSVRRRRRPSIHRPTGWTIV